MVLNKFTRGNVGTLRAASALLLVIGRSTQRPYHAYALAYSQFSVFRSPFSKQEFSKVYLLWRGQEQVAATDDFCDTHKSIVNDYCQLVGPGTVFSPYYIVTAMLGKVDVVLAIVPVGKGDDAVGND